LNQKPETIVQLRIFHFQRKSDCDAPLEVTPEPESASDGAFIIFSATVEFDGLVFIAG
jgi:hypothetical protein